MFDRAELLCRNEKYEEAKQLLKQYLLCDPINPGAHYLLGRTYMASTDVRDTSLAENEYQTALRLFLANGRISGIERYSPEYFELMCHLDSAKALWVQAKILAQEPTLLSTARGSVARAYEYIERARGVIPAAEEIHVVEALLRDLDALLRLPPG